MSILSPLGINNLLGSTSSNVLKETLSLTPPPKIVRKHYSEHEPLDYHEEHHYTKKKSRSIALTALTLLAFLFFLHILQQCLHDQIEMTMTTTAPTMIVQANIQAKEDLQEVGKNAPRDTNNDAVYLDSDEMEVTTPFGYMDMSNKPGISKEDDLYQYDKIHVPIKVKTVESISKIKKL